jgi:chromosome segregation ATPase
MYSTGLSHYRGLRNKDKALDQQRQALRQTQLELQTASNSVHPIRKDLEEVRTELGVSSLRIQERDAQLEDAQKACKRLQSEIKILRAELKQSRENFDQTIAAHEVSKIHRNQLRDQLREQRHNAEQKARKESDNLREASEALRSIEMELVRARHETTTAKREAQQAKEETRIKDKRLEFVQQQCALLQARYVQPSNTPDKTRTHKLETMSSEPLLNKSRGRKGRPGNRLEGNGNGLMSKDLLKQQNRRLSPSSEQTFTMWSLPE